MSATHPGRPAQPPLSGLTPDELTLAIGGSATRARALTRWLFGAGAQATRLPARIPGVAARALADISDRAPHAPMALLEERAAADRTVRLRLEARGHPVEAVLIPGPGRNTVCVSSQSGCARGCAFCATASLGLLAHLKAGEIVRQVLLARRLGPVRNVVFMGMGEPLDNLFEVLRAVEILIECAGLGARHITVSTCGVVPAMRRFLAECPARLALSLNATSDAQRAQIMPVGRRWPLAELLEVLRRAPQRRTLVEYVLLGGFNDTPDDARRLVELLDGLNVRVNLVPFNPHPGTTVRAPREEYVAGFVDALSAAGVRTLLRRPRGADLDAACGQLAGGGQTALAGDA